MNEYTQIPTALIRDRMTHWVELARDHNWAVMEKRRMGFSPENIGRSQQARDMAMEIARELKEFLS